jgi:antitoxin component YwqK of YwqJK toxin-antitoxin module
MISVWLCQSSFAQVKPIYFKGDEITTDSTKATSYAVFGKLSTDDLWLIKRYDLYNSLMVTGSFKDVQMKIPHGKFTYYEYVDVFNNANNTFFNFKGRERFTSGSGSFIDGKQNGIWLTFFPDGKVFTSSTFVNGVLHGEFSKYDRKGAMEIGGNYVNGKKDGEWIFASGLHKIVYQLDSVKSSVKDKKLLRREYSNGGFN